MKRPHFALPEIYDDSLSYYDVLRKLIKSMHVIADNLNKIPEQIANEAKARLLGDQGLQTNIDNEAQAREQADNTLQQNINSETSAREQADQEIREGVTNKISELKGDLANKLPKSPADWGPWTADEQAVARDRIGADGGEMELIAEVTTTEELDVISVSNFPGGTKLKLKSFMIYFVIPKASSDGLINSGYKINYGNNQSINRDSSNSLIKSGFNTHNNMYVLWNNARPIGIVTRFASWANGSTEIESVLKYDNYSDANANYISEVHLSKYTNGIKIPIGTMLKLYGVRA